MTIRVPLGPSGAPVAWSTIDLEDYERVIAYRWYLSGRGYAFRSRDGKSVFLHREVLGFPDSEDIDHVNGDKLDNRKENLHACTHLHNVRVGKNATVLPLRDEIRSLRMDGWTNTAIAGHYGISALSVCKYTNDLPRAPHPSLKWTRETLADAVRAFHAKHGRVPRSHDFNGKDGLPTAPSIYRQFDSIAELREAAGFGPIDFRSKEAA